MTDDKIYHYTWQRSDNKTTQRDQDGEEAPENFGLKVFDQIVLNDDAVQNIQQLDIYDPELCLPND